MYAKTCRAEIFQNLCALGSPYQFPPTLAFIAPETGAYRSPADPQQALEALLQKFGKSALVEAGVAARGDEGLQFTPALAAPHSPFVALYDNNDGRAYALVTSAGCLGHDSPPLFAGLQDRPTVFQLTNFEAGNFFVCASVADMILLRSLGFAATTAAGLTELKLKDIRALRGHFDICAPTMDEDNDNALAATAEPAADAPGSDAPAADRGRMAGEELQSQGPAAEATGPGEEPEFALEELALVLVAWSPSQLETGMPPCIAALEEHLRRLHKHFELTLKVTTWLASEADIAQMKFIITSQAVRWLQKSMLASLEHSHYKSLDGQMPQAPTPPRDYAEAVARLLGPGSEDKAVIPAPSNPHADWLWAQELLERDVVRPLIAQALRAPDRIEGTLTLGLAALSRVFHTQGLLLGKKLSKAVAAKGVDGQAEVPLDGVKQFIALAGRLQSMAAEIDRQHESATAGVIECPVIS